MSDVLPMLRRAKSFTAVGNFILTNKKKHPHRVLFLIIIYLHTKLIFIKLNGSLDIGHIPIDKIRIGKVAKYPRGIRRTVEKRLTVKVAGDPRLVGRLIRVEVVLTVDLTEIQVRPDTSALEMLDILPQHLGIIGPCPVCGGAGWPAVAIVNREDDPIDPDGCPRCGGVSAVKVLVLGNRPPDSRQLE